MENLIFEPLAQYKNAFKPQHKENVARFFEELVTKSGINEAENKKTVSAIKTNEEKLKNETKRLNRFKLVRTLLIVLGVILILAALFFFFNTDTFTDLGVGGAIAIGIGAALLGVGAFLLIFLVLNPRIKNASKRSDELRAIIQNLLELAWAQMKPLNELFDPMMTPKLVEQTVPLLKMDPYFDSKRFDYLHSKYGLANFTSVDESVEFVQSGEISGNPFILSRVLKTTMGQQVYTGSLTITYTVTVYVNNKPQTQVRTQVLNASVTKPKPFYKRDTHIIYGNEAAERLSFTRKPVIKRDWTDKSLRSLIASEEKKMSKLVSDSLKKGTNFMPLGNSTFEAFFQAYDRDHETQFRLLFTPLAQNEMINLLKDKEVGFGDNFIFHKRKNLNEIYSYHSQEFDYSANPRHYYDYDITKIRERFNNYNNSYLHRFYFNLAPVLTIPLYQQHKPHEFIYQTEYESFLSFYEHESTANQFSKADLAHPETKTDTILKTSLVTKGADYDIIKIDAYSYRTVQRTDFVPRRGADGRMHSVPVHWVEYIPLHNTVNATIKVANEETEKVYRNENALTRLQEFLKEKTGGKVPIRNRHVFAFLLAGSFGAKDNEAINNIVSDFHEEN